MSRIYMFHCTGFRLQPILDPCDLIKANVSKKKKKLFIMKLGQGLHPNALPYGFTAGSRYQSHASEKRTYVRGYYRWSKYYNRHDSSTTANVSLKNQSKSRGQFQSNHEWAFPHKLMQETRSK